MYSGESSVRVLFSGCHDDELLCVVVGNARTSMTILAAIGEDRRSNPIVSVAHDLALAFEAPLVVLHVVPQREFDEHRQAMVDLPDFADVSFTQEEGSAAKFAEAVVRETLGEFDADVVETVGRVGDPVDEIHEVAEELDARHLVIGGRRRSAAGKAIFGSTTQSVLLGSAVPVTTVMED
jgi:nucleotide-binding universal stress UspA family protein